MVQREKMKLEQEKTQGEADIRIQEGEISNLQKDLDGLIFTVQQLESQKMEAQKKLDELDDQVSAAMHLKWIKWFTEVSFRYDIVLFFFKLFSRKLSYRVLWLNAKRNMKRIRNRLNLNDQRDHLLIILKAIFDIFF